MRVDLKKCQQDHEATKASGQAQALMIKDLESARAEARAQVQKLEFENRKGDHKIRDIQKFCGEHVQKVNEMNTYLRMEAAKSDAENKQLKEGMRSEKTRVEKLQSEMKILQVQNSQFARENASLKNGMARLQEVCRSAGEVNPQAGPSKPKSLSGQLISQAETRQAEKRQWVVTKRKRVDYSKRLKSEEAKHWSRAKKLQSQNTQLVADKIELESQVSELLTMISNADTQARSSESLGILQSEVADLKRQLAQVEAKKAELESQVSNPQPMVLNADGGITQPARSLEDRKMLQSEVAELKRKLDQGEEKATKRVRGLEAEVQRLNSLGLELESKYNTLCRDDETRRHDHEALHSTHETLCSAHKALHSDHEALKSRMSTPNINIGTMTMAESRDEIISGMEKEIEELESKLSSQDKEMDNLKSELTGVKSSQANSASQAGASDMQLRIELDECEEKIAALQTEIERRDSETKALAQGFDKKTEALNCELNKREEQNKAFERKLKFKEAEIERELRLRDTEAKNRASAVEMERQFFKSTGEELTRRSGEVERFQSLCDQLHRCVDAMDGQLGGLAEAADNQKKFQRLIEYDEWKDTLKSTEKKWRENEAVLKLSSWESSPW